MLICKDHDPPVRLWSLEALSRRVHPSLDVTPDIEDALRIVRVGDRGERSLDYYVDIISTPDLSCFFDLRLPREKNFFQMDTLLITPRFLMIVEVKNMSGDIYFKKETKQMLRVLNGTIENFPNPVFQVSQQKLQLQQFLKINHLPEIPIYTLVVFVSRKGILHIEPNDHFHLRNVITLQEFIFKYQKLHETLTHTVWKDTDLALAKELFLREHTPEKIDLMDRFGLTKNQLLKGVQCPKCNRIGMERVHGRWFCQCKVESKDAHINGLRDYGLLINNWISNKDARDFLNIENREVTRYLLSQLKVPTTGKGKGAKYNIGDLVISS